MFRQIHCHDPDVQMSAGLDIKDLNDSVYEIQVSNLDQHHFEV